MKNSDNKEDVPAGCVRRLVLHRVKLTGTKVIALKAGRECDPCCCGDQKTWHKDCYGLYAEWSRLEKPATPKNCAEWRKFILENAGGMARELAALDSESTTDFNG